MGNLELQSESFQAKNIMAAFPLKMTVFMLVIFSAISGVFSQATPEPYACDELTNCDARGRCSTDDDGDWICLCDDGYTTHPANDPGTAEEDQVFCNYKQKQQLTAFLLQWFFGYFGGGHWYVGLTTLAGWHLGVALFICCGTCCIAAVAAGAQEPNALVAVNCCACCGFLGLFVWWLVDIIRFGMNWYKDGNGVELESW